MYQALVIGGGFSGLAAALALRAAGVDCCLIEARDRVGGRIKSGTLAGLTIDLGGMWLSPTQTRLKHFAAQYEVATYPTHLEGDSLFRLQGKLHRGPRESVDGMFSLFEGLEYYRAMRRLKRLSGPLDCEAPWKHPQAAELDEITVEAWLCRHIRSELNMPMRVAHSVERLSCSY